MNASISLIKWEEKFIINEVRKIQRMKIYAMWHMPQQNKSTYLEYKSNYTRRT